MRLVFKVSCLRHAVSDSFTSTSNVDTVSANPIPSSYGSMGARGAAAPWDCSSKMVRLLSTRIMRLYGGTQTDGTR